MGIAIGAEDSIFDSAWIPIRSRGLFHDDNNAEYAARHSPTSRLSVVANDERSRAILNERYNVKYCD